VKQCLSDTVPTMWPSVQSTITEFGADYLNITSKTATPRVTAVTLRGVHGNIALKKVTLVPFGGVGNGFSWDSRTYYSSAQGWSQRKMLPATLNYRVAPASMGEGATGAWQVVVGFAITGNGGAVDHLDIAYSSNGKTYHIKGAQSLAVVAKARDCLDH